MQPRSGSATEFVLQTLREHGDRELRLADLDELAQGRFQPGNMGLSLKLLLQHGLVVKTKDGREAWWAISTAAPFQASAQGTVPEPAATPELAPAKVFVKRPTMVIPRGRW